MAILTPEEYRKQAEAMYDPGYNSRIALANSNFNTGLTGYDNAINSLNLNFKQNVNATNRNTKLNQNAFNNNTLSRGMGRSSIATTGLAGIQNTGNRVVGELTEQKNTELDNIEALKAALRQNLSTTLEGYAADREVGLTGLATQLMDKANEIEYRNARDKKADEQWEQTRSDNQIAEARRIAKETYDNFMANKSKEEDKAEDTRRWGEEFQLEKDKLALDKQKATTSSNNASKPSAAETKHSLMSEITGNVAEAMNDGNGIEYIQAMTPEWIAAGLDMTDIVALKKYAEDYVRTPEQIKAATQKQNNRRPADFGL